MAEHLIRLDGISKRFNYNWIFKDIDFEFRSGHPSAIIGPNGSGKSTLLQIIAGMVSPSDGSITYQLNGKAAAVEQIFQHVSMATPAMEIIEEMRLPEILEFHFRFKKPVEGIDKNTIVEMLGFGAEKEIRNYSSGMKQRLKLALAVFSKSEILLLDEPTNNLDEQGQRWYNDLIDRYCSDRVLIVSSNEPREYAFCQSFLNVRG